ncbi:MAG: ATP-binding cassette domain-containing protein [Actinobacteria bacterium]|nr:ATP-binding cassette domain-containing protein [Actinomycetota bacterium]
MAAKTGKGRTMAPENKRYLLLAAMVLVLFATFSVISDGFLAFDTAMNIARQAAALALIAIAMTMIMITGGIDLSVGSTIALSAAVGALCVRMFPPDDWRGAAIGFVATITVAVAMGALNGFCAGYLGVAPFIVTLATMSLARGLALTLTESQSIRIENTGYNWFGQADILGVVPWSMVLVAAGFVLAWFVLTKLGFGRRTYAIGDNIDAARASGVDVKRQTLMVYVVAGVLVGLAALIVAGRARSAQSQAGIGMEFNAITAVVLGGVSLFGGQGKLRGTALGVLLTSVIFTGLGMLDVKPSFNYLVKGLLIIVAVLSDPVLWVSVRQGFAKGSRKTGHALAEIQAHAGKLTLREISKSFPGVHALDDVSLQIERGKIHALCGENGAGKSTLMKILSGVYTKDSGSIFIDDQPVTISSPVDSRNLGIAVIYQESANIPELNVTQNVNLGRESVLPGRLLLDRPAMRRKTTALLSRFDLDIDLNSKVEELSVGKQQMVEIAKAFGSNAWVVVMDEPTSAISESDKDTLFKMIRELKEHNVAVVYISHRMSEIFEIADEVTILRDGKHVITGPTEEFNENAIVKHMVGRELSNVFHRGTPSELGSVVLEVKELHRRGVFAPISFQVHEGEVLSLSGLVGAGRTEIMRCIFGLDKADGGEIHLNGRRLDIRRPSDAIEAGIVYVSEDRRREGILPHLSVRENISLPGLKLISSYGVVDRAKDKAIATRFVQTLNVKTPTIEQVVMNLSGGNQQKVCLAKWLNIGPKLVILDEPTRGVDVGAKAEIHQLIHRLTDDGVAVIMISSEMPEILGASDRILVLHEGHVVREFQRGEKVTQEALMRSASGLSSNE